MRLYLLVLLAGLASGNPWDKKTPLDEYVNSPDPNFAFSEYDSYSQDGYTMYLYNLTSLQYMNESIVEDSVWWHYLSVAIPDQVRFNDAMMLLVGSGGNDDDPPAQEGDMELQRIGNIAASTGTVTAYVKMNPNQPLYYVEEPIPRFEDMIIGYSWRVYIEKEGTPDPNIVLQLPMVKSAKLAVDAAVQIAAEKNPSIQITRYMPTGFSKRGWVAYLLAAVDRRVFCAAPVVFSVLNFRENLHHHFRSLGGWSWAFTPYWAEGITVYLDHPRTTELAGFIDPFAYNERLTMPKLIIQATGDQFFLADDSHYFWDKLNGQNYFLMIENTDHGTSGRTDDVYKNMEAFYLAQLTGFKLPQLNWQRNETETSGSISLNTDTTPTVIRAFMADTNTTFNRRDFRAASTEGESDIVWNEYAVQDQGSGSYYAEFDKINGRGWRGFLISAQFPGPEGRTIDLTSEVNIIPDTMPFPRCTTPEECEGEIV